jgi:hypothetical protein
MTEYKLEEMDVQEIAEFLENYHFSEDPEDQYDDDWAGWMAVEECSYGDGHETPIGHLSLVDQHGGEGQGDQYWIVVRLTQGDVSRTFKKEGWYASHHGHEFDGFNSDTFSEVSQVQKTITVWE